MTTLAAPKTEKSAQIAYRPRRLGHVNLFVENMEETCTFLHEICGFEQTGIIGKSRSAFYSNGNTHHDIGFIETDAYVAFRKKYPDPADPPGRGTVPSLNHFGWEMEHEKSLVDAYQRAMAQGVKPRITNNGTSLSNYLFDPEGMQHQFYADEELDWRKVYTGGDVDLHRPASWVPGKLPPSTDHNYDPDPKLRRDAAAPLHPMRVTHGAIVATHYDQTLDYYTRVAGLEPVYSGRNGDFCYLRGAASHFDIVLLRPAPGLPGGFHHAAFEVWPDEDLDRAEAALKKRGVRILHRADLPHKASLCIAGPSGIPLEFYIRRGGDFSAVDGFDPVSRAFNV